MGPSVGASIESLPASIGASVSYLGASEFVDGPTHPGLAMRALMFTPRACWLEETSGFVAGPCAATSVGAVWARAFGAEQSTPTHHGIQTTELGLMMRFVRFGGFLALETDLSVPWRRTEYRLFGSAVHRANVVGGRLALQLGLSL
ncbi:MAG: hypothetical protein QM784_08830 [Polyangiaceae bacterium]